MSSTKEHHWLAACREVGSETLLTLTNGKPCLVMAFHVIGKSRGNLNVLSDNDVFCLEYNEAAAAWTDSSGNCLPCIRYKAQELDRLLEPHLLRELRLLVCAYLPVE